MRLKLLGRNMYRVEGKIVEKLKEQNLNAINLLQEYTKEHKKPKIDFSKITQVGKQLDEELIEIGNTPDTIDGLKDEEILLMLKRNREISEAYGRYGEKVKEILK